MELAADQVAALHGRRRTARHGRPVATRQPGAASGAIAVGEIGVAASRRSQPGRPPPCSSRTAARGHSLGKRPIWASTMPRPRTPGLSSLLRTGAGGRRRWRSSAGRPRPSPQAPRPAPVSPGAPSPAPNAPTPGSMTWAASSDAAGLVADDRLGAQPPEAAITDAMLAVPVGTMTTLASLIRARPWCSARRRCRRGHGLRAARAPAP